LTRAKKCLDFNPDASPVPPALAFGDKMLPALYFTGNTALGNLPAKVPQQTLETIQTLKELRLIGKEGRSVAVPKN